MLYFFSDKYNQVYRSSLQINSFNNEVWCLQFFFCKHSSVWPTMTFEKMEIIVNIWFLVCKWGGGVVFYRKVDKSVPVLSFLNSRLSGKDTILTNHLMRYDLGLYEHTLNHYAIDFWPGQSIPYKPTKTKCDELLTFSCCLLEIITDIQTRKNDKFINKSYQN